jgi:hypothetical protein
MERVGQAPTCFTDAHTAGTLVNLDVRLIVARGNSLDREVSCGEVNKFVAVGSDSKLQRVDTPPMHLPGSHSTTKGDNVLAQACWRKTLCQLLCQDKCGPTQKDAALTSGRLPSMEVAG